MSKETPYEPEHPITIGYAEDDHWELNSTVKTLTENGFVVDFAVNDGEQLVRAARKAKLRPDIYLTDLNMPERDGITAAAIILNEWPDSKVILMTNESGLRYVSLARAAGVVAYIPKLITRDELCKVIRDVYRRGKTNIGEIR